MLTEDSLIGVSSRTFCKSKDLRKSLETKFKNIRYNDDLLHFDEKSLIDFFEGCEGVLISEDKITKAVIDELPKLKVISKFGVGLDSIDLDYIREKEITLGWKPGINSFSVAELALSYMIILLREAYFLNRCLLNSEWQKVRNSRDLSDLTIGIIGYGHIGKKLALFLEPFGSKILIYDPLIKPNKKLSNNVESSSFNNLLRNCDAVSIHVPLTKENHNLISEKELMMMKKDSVLINLSRGGVVNEHELFKALKNNHLSGAASDVFIGEPTNTTEFSSELINLDNFFSTPHIAGTSNQTISKLGHSAIKFLIDECEN
ncbi:MAG: phosphoglycerate dehydrogenase [Flavobacteriales bacterium]|nr:phosphoglycerate dehydrogenase [Flavobacteriales bacterium]